MAAHAERAFWAGRKEQNRSSSFTITGVIDYSENQKLGPHKLHGTVKSKAE